MKRRKKRGWLGILAYGAVFLLSVLGLPLLLLTGGGPREQGAPAGTSSSAPAGDRPC
ncbi:MAG TPA: hypothetical protein H9795_11310 [Candidatus Fournierella merdigallinarum]|nr:hypothetical protein [Candidatus Fournierella merdigallinarum]